MNFRSIAQLSDQVLNWSHRLPRDIDLIVGIPRSGMLPANILALYRHLPFTDLSSFLEGRIIGVGRRLTNEIAVDDYLRTPRRVLVLDDSVGSGDTMATVKARVAAANTIHHVQYAAVYVYPERTDAVDHYCEALSPPRVFEWNVLGARVLKEACVDMNGVLCVDPTQGENDGSDAYLSFLKDAQPLLEPRYAIGWIVTSRLEKYRAQTEDWLARHNVKYQTLVMLDYPEEEMRRRLGIHSAYKADVYRQVGAQLFIESSVQQAFEIANLALKPVLCIDTMQLIQPGMMPLHRPVLRTGDVNAEHKKTLGKRLRKRLGSTARRFMGIK